jgi:hypothetical protein
MLTRRLRWRKRVRQKAACLCVGRLEPAMIRNLRPSGRDTARRYERSILFVAN